jgi:GNAT superfamily N-acetyltransferase
LTSPTIVAAGEIAPQALTEAFNASFAHYVAGTMTLDVPGLSTFLARQGADAALSRVAVDAASRPLGFVFIGRRPERDGPRCRVGAMGLLPETRGSGLAQALLERVITEAGVRGDTAIELEVFAQNPRAHRLYLGFGFGEVMPLHGYTCDASAVRQAEGPAPAPAVLPLAAAADWLARQAADMPFQQSAHLLRAPTTRGTAWRAGTALLVFDLPQDSSVLALRVVHDADAARGSLAGLVKRLAAEHPQRRLQMPALLAPHLGGDVLEQLGFVRQPLHQYLMRRALR